MSRSLALAPALFLAAFLPLAGPLSAQEVSGAIEGRVLEGSAAPLAGARVEVSGPSLQGTRAVETDERGRFRFVALPAGKYRLEVGRLGHRTTVVEGVVVRLGRTTSVGPLSLPTEAVEMEPLVVRADRAPIDPASTTLGTTLDAEAVEALPTDRDYLSIVTLLPQSNRSHYGDELNISGATGFDNAYYVDGVHVTEPFEAGGATNLPHDFVDHIELKTGGIEAEHGRALGGIVNVVTRSGGNEFEASFFSFFTNSSLSSTRERGVLELEGGSFTRYDVGLSLGGPVVRDRLWYFLAYDADVEREELELPGDIGERTDRTLSHQFAGKLTWRATPNTDLVLTLIGDPTTRDLVGNSFFAQANPPRALANPDPFLADVRAGGVTVSLAATQKLGQDLVIEASLARSDVRNRERGATERGRTEMLFQDATAGVWSGGFGNEADFESDRTAASLKGSYYLGDHSLKAGVQVEDNVLDSEILWRSDGPAGVGNLQKLSENLFVGLPLEFRTRTRNRVVSVFAQGSFLLHPRVRLKPGIRWDGQYFDGLTSGFDGAITDQVQPRIGVVVYPDDDRASQKITASYARYYEQLPMSPVMIFYGGLEQRTIFWDHDPREDASGGQVNAFVARASDDLAGQYYDEVTLGYERAVGEGIRLAVRGIYRTIREIIALPFVSPDLELAGNPGRGQLDFLPDPEHEYTGLELTVSRVGAGDLDFLGSYVWSRTVGNYTGLFDQDGGVANPNGPGNYVDPLALEDGGGRLPNDRPHVFKAFGSYRFDAGLQVGGFFTWQSGTPLNELGAHPTNPFQQVFLRPRGTGGRTPSIWDLSLHLAYGLPASSGLPFGSVLKLDVLHAFSPQRPVHLVQQRFLAVDPATGDQVSPNPNYLAPLAHQPPMTVRLGVELRMR